MLKKNMFKDRMTSFSPVLNLRVLNEISHVTLERSVVSIIRWGDPTGRLFHNFCYLCQSLTPAKETDRNN